MKLSFKYRFEAAHRFVNGSSKCTTPHGHTWWVELTLYHKADRINPEINFSWDFKDLKKEWRAFVDETLDHSFFCNNKDPLLPALLKVHDQSRVLCTPGDPTTEILSALFFIKAQKMFQKFEGVQVLGLTLQETPTNSVSLTEEDLESYLSFLKSGDSWWNQVDPLSREFSEIAVKNTSSPLLDL